MMKKKDGILIGVILLITVVSFILVGMMKQEGTKVLMTLDGETYGTYDLNKDQTITVESEEGYNTVQMKDGKVSMIEADCPNQVCVHSYPLSEGEVGTIVCLPHKVIVEIQE